MVCLYFQKEFCSTSKFEPACGGNGNTNNAMNINHKSYVERTSS